MPARENDCASFVRTYFQGRLKGGSVPLSSHGLQTACLREVLINNQENNHTGGIISFKGVKKCLLGVPLINLIWLCQSPVTRSPRSNAGLLHEDEAVPVRAVFRSACSFTPPGASGKPEAIAPAWAFQTPSPPTKGYFPKTNLSSHSPGFNSCPARQFPAGAGVLRGSLKTHQIRWAKACSYLGHSSGVCQQIPAWPAMKCKAVFKAFWFGLLKPYLKMCVYFANSEP